MCCSNCECEQQYLASLSPQVGYKAYLTAWFCRWKLKVYGLYQAPFQEVSLAARSVHACLLQKRRLQSLTSTAVALQQS